MSTILDTDPLNSLLINLKQQVLSGRIPIEQLRWFVNLSTDERTALVTEWVYEPTTDILLPLPCSPLILPPTDGTKTILNSTNVFTGHIDQDFKDYRTNQPSTATPETSVMVYELVKDRSFKVIFDSLNEETERLCLTQSQIVEFVRLHKQHLGTDKHSATFFLFKGHGFFLIARIHLNDGQPLVFSNQVEVYHRLPAIHQHRFVVPQL